MHYVFSNPVVAHAVLANSIIERISCLCLHALLTHAADYAHKVPRLMMAHGVGQWDPSTGQYATNDIVTLREADD